MSILSNAHTHTTYCDGKASIEQMIESAVAKGFQCLGFSGHSYSAVDESYVMSRAGTVQYMEELQKMKEKYSGIIDILTGIEWDYYSQIDRTAFDYTIGSVHHLYSPATKKYYAVDYLPEEMEACLKEGFQGDEKAMLKAYYHLVTETAVMRKPTILGHFDLIRKLNAGNRFFNEESPEYMEIALDAVEKAVRAGAVIEVYTGGIYRGYCATPYPAEPLLKRIQSLGGKVILSSDSHDPESLDFLFSETEKKLKEFGFQEVMVLTRDGLKEQKLQP